MVPSDIEQHVFSHPAVADVAVVGLPHELDGDLPLAFVVLKSGQATTADEIIRHTNGTYASSLVITRRFETRV